MADDFDNLFTSLKTDLRTIRIDLDTVIVQTEKINPVVDRLKKIETQLSWRLPEQPRPQWQFVTAAIVIAVLGWLVIQAAFLGLSIFWPSVGCLTLMADVINVNFGAEHTAFACKLG